MKITNKSIDEFEVLGDSGIKYITTFKTCTCPVYTFRKKTCKHIKFVLENISNVVETSMQDKILEVIKTEGEISFHKLEELFGKDVYMTLDLLEQHAEVFHNTINDTYKVFE